LPETALIRYPVAAGVTLLQNDLNPVSGNSPATDHLQRKIDRNPGGLETSEDTG